MKESKRLKMISEAIVTTLIDELKRLNDNLEYMNELEVNRQIVNNELELEEVRDYDSSVVPSR